MIHVPIQLKDERFIPIYCRDGQIHPIESNWQVDKNYSFSTINGRFRNFWVYGVVLGFSGLYVVDFDSEDAQNLILSKLPPTFTVKSGGKGLYHLYYREPKGYTWNKAVDNSKGERLIDVLGMGKMAIGPSSLHRRTKKPYTTVKDIDITNYSQDDLDKVLTEAFRSVSSFKSGKRSTGRHQKMVCCPFHGDKHPSMAIYKDTFFCFGCRRYGQLEVLRKKGVEF